MGRHRPGSARFGSGILGFVLPFERAGDPLIQTLLPLSAFAVLVLAVGLLSSTGELLAAGLLCLAACIAGFRDAPPRQSRVSPGLPARQTETRHAGMIGPLSRLPDGKAAARTALAGPTPRLLPEGLPSAFGLTLVNRTQRIVWCNDTAAAHFAIDLPHDVGRPVASLVRQPAFGAYLAAGNFSKSLRIPTAQADGLILSVQFVPYVAGGWLVLSRNVTRVARLEATRRECIANVSHELRTPLTLLVGFLETLRDIKLDARQSRDYLDRMQKQCVRMQRTIENLLELSMLEAEPEPCHGARVNVGAMLARIHAEASALSAGRHRIVLEAEDGFDLLGAEDELFSAFGNLASNAVRYTERGGLVRIVWRAASTGAEFVVEDTGVGIERQHIPRLTERFYRVDRNRSLRCGSTGLGLAIVKRVLLRHQATLEIESEPGRGSRFIARFPARRVAGAAESPVAAHHHS